MILGAGSRVAEYSLAEDNRSSGNPGRMWVATYCPNQLAQAIDDARLREVVGRHLHLHTVAGGQADKAFAHLAADVGEDLVLVVQLHPEHRAGQDDRDVAFDREWFFHGQD